MIHFSERLKMKKPIELPLGLKVSVGKRNKIGVVVGATERGYLVQFPTGATVFYLRKNVKPMELVK